MTDVAALLELLPPEIRDFARLLVTLAETMGEQKLSPVRIEAYHRNLQDVPIPLLALTVDRMIQQIGSDSFRWTALPPVADIRKWAEIVRREEIPKHAISACVECDSTRWRPVLVDGVSRVQRCPCLTRHQSKLEGLGLPMKALTAAPVTRDEPEPEPRAYPTRDQLPGEIQSALDHVRARKVLR